MPKRPIKKELMVGDIISTLLAGHHVYRPDLLYPESHSDMKGAVEGLLLKYDVKLRPLPRERSELWEEEIKGGKGVNTDHDPDAYVQTFSTGSASSLDTRFKSRKRKNPIGFQVISPPILPPKPKPVKK